MGNILIRFLARTHLCNRYDKPSVAHFMRNRKQPKIKW